MKTIKNNAQVYKAPVCKMVEVQMRSNVLLDTSNPYSLGRPGDDTDINELGELE